MEVVTTLVLKHKPATCALEAVTVCASSAVSTPPGLVELAASASFKKTTSGICSTLSILPEASVQANCSDNYGISHMQFCLLVVEVLGEVISPSALNCEDLFVLITLKIGSRFLQLSYFIRYYPGRGLCILCTTSGLQS